MNKRELDIEDRVLRARHQARLAHDYVSAFFDDLLENGQGFDVEALNTASFAIGEWLDATEHAARMWTEVVADVPKQYGEAALDAVADKMTTAIIDGIEPVLRKVIAGAAQAG